MEGCGGRLELLVPTTAAALASSTAPCCFGKACAICEAPLPLSPLPPADMLPAQHAGAEWQTVQDEFVVVALLKGTKRLAPCVHLADGLIDVVAVPKKENMDHLELLKSSLRYLRAADRASKGRGPGAERRGADIAETHTQHDEDGFIIRKALAVRLAPADERHSFNIDGEVHAGRPIEVRVLARAFKCCLAERPAHARDAGHLDKAKHEALEVAGRVGKHALDLARPLLSHGEDKGKKLVEEVQSAAARAVTSAAASPAVRGATDALKSLRLV